MNLELNTLKEERADLERQIAALEGSRSALYTPGITVVPQQGAVSSEIDQQLEQLRAAIVEIDTKINAVSGEV
jgi:hypothetical protein